MDGWLRLRSLNTRFTRINYRVIYLVMCNTNDFLPNVFRRNFPKYTAEYSQIFSAESEEHYTLTIERKKNEI
jgi:hypothetical protein